MNVFDSIIEKQDWPERTLGNPLRDPISIARRLNFYSHIMKGKGFRQVADGPKKDAQGLTRGDKKRALRESTNKKVSG